MAPPTYVWAVRQKKVYDFSNKWYDIFNSFIIQYWPFVIAFMCSLVLFRWIYLIAMKIYERYTSSKFSNTIVASSTKSPAALNQLIREEHGNNHFVSQLKKVMYGTRTFGEVVKEHMFYKNEYTADQKHQLMINIGLLI